MTEQTGQGPEPAHERASATQVGARGPEGLPDEVGAEPGQADRATAGAGRPEAGVAVLPAFDDHHPPAQELIDDCVHCGFCLPTCPTYVLWGEEMDSPRGRILLMRAGHEEEGPLTAAQVQAWDNCLGCMACVTACPSGVQYDKLIEDTRAQVERRWARPRVERLRRRAIFALFPHPQRMRWIAPFAPLARPAARALRRFPRLRALAAQAPPRSARVHLPEVTPPLGTRRGR